MRHVLCGTIGDERTSVRMIAALTDAARPPARILDLLSHRTYSDYGECHATSTEVYLREWTQSSTLDASHTDARKTTVAEMVANFTTCALFTGDSVTSAGREVLVGTGSFHRKQNNVPTGSLWMLHQRSLIGHN